MSSGKLLRPRQGLTLIEVVVLMMLIAGVAYLAYIALPSYQDWRQQAKYIEASSSKNGEVPPKREHKVE